MPEEGESEWDEHERDLMVALLLLDRDRGHHGHPMSEATSPDADPTNPEGSFYYVGEFETDFADQAIERAKAEFKAQYPNASMDGRRFFARRIERE